MHEPQRSTAGRAAAAGGSGGTESGRQPAKPKSVGAADPAPAPAPGRAPGTAARERSTPEGDGLDPTRYGDWEKNGRCIDF